MYAEELVELTALLNGDWNYANAIEDSNIVRGRIAVIEGRIDDAKTDLIEVGESPGL